VSVSRRTSAVRTRFADDWMRLSRKITPGAGRLTPATAQPSLSSSPRRSSRTVPDRDRRSR
jgi:hypothetical protein